LRENEGSEREPGGPGNGTIVKVTNIKEKSNDLEAVAVDERLKIPRSY